MKIKVETTEKPKVVFEQLKTGEVFAFKSDIEGNEEDIAGYLAMKTDDDTYVYLDNGMVDKYIFVDEPVVRVEAELVVWYSKK